MANAQVVVSIYLTGENEKHDLLGHYYMSEDERKRLVDDFVSYHRDNQPKAGSYQGVSASGSSGHPKLIALRFDLVAAVA